MQNCTTVLLLPDPLCRLRAPGKVSKRTHVTICVDRHQTANFDDEVPFLELILNLTSIRVFLLRDSFKM